jgi:hypothetical protein
MTSVSGEVLVLDAATGVWTLAFTPSAGVAVYCNGLRQKQELDYKLNGASLISPFWIASDIVLCDYEHA